MIYGAVCEGDESVIKIGYSGTSVLERMDGMQTGNWRRIVCVAVMPGTQQDEGLLHRQFSHYHVRGEWFLNFGDVAEWARAWAIKHDTRLEYTKSEIRIRKQAKEHAAARALAEYNAGRGTAPANDEQPLMRTTFPVPERVVTPRSERAKQKRCAWPGRCECSDCVRRRSARPVVFEWRGKTRGGSSGST